MTSELESPSKTSVPVDQVDVRGPRFAAWVTTAARFSSCVMAVFPSDRLGICRRSSGTDKNHRTHKC